MKSLLVIACFALTGCSWFAHKAKRIEAPSAEAIHQAADRAEKSTASAVKAAAKAGEHLVRAKARHSEAIASHKAEENHIADAEKKVTDLVLRVTVELRPEVDALASDIERLRAQHSTTNAALLDTGSEIGESTVAASEALRSAQQAKAEQEVIRTKHSLEYEAKVSEIVAKANATEKAYAKADTERLHLLGQKTALISIAVLSIIAGLVLKFYKPL
tara:strand:- start:491 stop:1141 length:651 start_codon:yes stop_codon:yes gene_type:complete